ncbi:helix-turn-helix domain-containing protein [Paenibacillus naphthalenovorans]|uniref:helix-turn-helix domain-containing protein n=1 Tax=Paenibacillus naphthalenovorans TaxID=162209 RepID=UPI003D27C8ED
MLNFGLGKKRSRLGKWLDRHGKTQEWLIRESGLGRNTIMDLANDGGRSPNARTMQKILNALRTIDPNVKADDFWPM